MAAVYLHNALFGPPIPDDNPEHDTDEEIGSAEDAHQRQQSRPNQQQPEEITYPPQPQPTQVHSRRAYRVQSSGDYWKTTSSEFPFETGYSTSPSPPYVTPPSEPEDSRGQQQSDGGWAEAPPWTRPQPLRQTNVDSRDDSYPRTQSINNRFIPLERQEIHLQQRLDSTPPGLTSSVPIHLSETQLYNRNHTIHTADTPLEPTTHSPPIGIGGGRLMDDDADSSSDAMMRKRPRGRRRRVKSSASTLTTTTTTTKPRLSITSPLGANPEITQRPLVYTHDIETRAETEDIQRASRIVSLPLRPGRIPNTRMSARKRRWILIVRVLLTIFLSVWAAYSTARYWLAYSEYRPRPNADTTNPYPKEDPPRSLYALALAITSTVAVTLFAIDSAYLLYFAIYPHEKRPLGRVPTIGPIARNGTRTVADPQTLVPPQPRTSYGGKRPLTAATATTATAGDDKYTAIPLRSSAFSATSSGRRSRRLSKPPPEDWLATYPPFELQEELVKPADAATMERAYVGSNGRTFPSTDEPSHPLAPEPVATSSPDEPVRPSRFVHHERSSGRVVPADAASTSTSRPTSQKLDEPAKSTYALNFPVVCHEPSISPLPPPVGSVPSAQPDPLSRTGTVSGSRMYPGAGSQLNTRGGSKFYPTPGASRFSTASMRRRRKWAKTRILLHVLHWFAFVAINIPGFVNVGLVPVWYNPAPTADSSGANTGVNSPHRLSGLCRWSPDVLWAGSAFPPSYPPPCAQTVSYRAWLWGAIGRVLITFFVAGLWIVVDGVWWGAWVVGTRNIGWRGAVGRPWTPSSIRRRQQQRLAEEKLAHIDEGDATGESENDHGTKRESAFVRRIRLLSAASRASGKSGRSSKSHHTKEKAGELSEGERPPPLPTMTAHAYASPQESATPIGSGTDVEDEVVSPTTKTTTTTTGATKHRVRRKPVRPISFPGPDSTPSSPPTNAIKDIYSPASERSSQEKSRSTYYPPMPGGGIGSRRPSAQGSIGGSTVVGSPLGTKHLSASFEPFNPSSPPSAAQSPLEERGRRSIGLDIVHEHHFDREVLEGEDAERMREYPERPQSRLARYNDDDIPPLIPYRSGARAPSPPSPTAPLYPPTTNTPERGWTTDPNAFSPVVSPNTGAPLLEQGYFLVGDGGFSSGEVNEGAYDDESYYRTVSNGTIASGVDRSTTPLSDRSASPSSYGHVLNPEDRQETESPVEERRYTSRSQYLSPSSSQQQRSAPYQHPLAQGIQLAMGRPPETFEREVRMLGGVVRRMSTIESFGSHERELSRRGSGATARTTTRGNSGGVGRENTNGSGNSGGGLASSLPSPHSPVHGSGSGGQMERSSEGEAVGAIARSNSPTDISPPL